MMDGSVPPQEGGSSLDDVAQLAESDLGDDLVETHGAKVFFVGEYVYKVKKPVRFEFFDFSTPELRLAVLQRELDLNCRLSPDVYLRVLEVVDSDGEVVDYALKMRRMPDERRLSRLVTERVDVTGCLDRIASVVAKFHARADTSTAISEAASPEAVLKNWRDNFGEMRAADRHGEVIPDSLLDEAQALSEQYVAGRTKLFDERIAQGCVRDGHGDLLAGDIFCLDDGPRILDCIEFADHFRWGDVIADAAFLAMDLEFLDRGDLAQEFLTRYVILSGEQGFAAPPQSLIDHYVAYRAQVRAKVTLLRYLQGDQSALAPAKQLAELCLHHIRRAQVSLILVGGAPGTGKSTLAGALADRLGCRVVRSDQVRKDLAGIVHSDHSHAHDEQLYNPTMDALTYGEMLERAQEPLSMGESIILDATWSRAQGRERAMDMARETGSELVELECELAPVLVAERLKGRLADPTDASDATVEIAQDLAARRDPWPSAEPINMALRVEVTTEQALEVIGLLAPLATI